MARVDLNIRKDAEGELYTGGRERGSLCTLLHPSYIEKTERIFRERGKGDVAERESQY